MKLIIAALVCYLIGCINPAYIIGKVKGYDIRSRGSMNAGASNVMINVGKKAGVLTALFDIFKSFFCYRMAARLFPLYTAAAVFCAVCCVLGHIFPFYLKFKGGKGFASLGGVVLGFNVKVFFIMLFCAFLIVLVIRYLCLITTLTALSFPVWNDGRLYRGDNASFTRADNHMQAHTEFQTNKKRYRSAVQRHMEQGSRRRKNPNQYGETGREAEQ